MVSERLSTHTSKTKEPPSKWASFSSQYHVVAVCHPVSVFLVLRYDATLQKGACRPSPTSYILVCVLCRDAMRSEALERLHPLLSQNIDNKSFVKETRKQHQPLFPR